jgi:ATP-dependent DNA helicase RecG
MEKDKGIEFGIDDKEEYLSHSVWSDDEEINGLVENEFYFNKDKGVIEDKPTTDGNNTYKSSFDDDINLECRLEDLRLTLIKQYLYDIKGDLYQDALKISIEEIGKKLDIIKESSGTLKVKNIGVLMFTERPKEFIPGSYINLVHFENSSADKKHIMTVFDGPIHEQIRGVLRYVETYVLKINKLESGDVCNYPIDAIKEAVVNAVYHKNYKLHMPIEIRIDRTKVVIISYPGADKIVDENEINEGEVCARIYRNLRVGEFLQSLVFTTGNSTGLGKMIKAMQINNSSKPIFKTNENRDYFLVRLNVNETFLDEKQVVSNKKQEYEEDLNLTEKKILEILKDGPLSKKEIVNAFGYKNVTRDIKIALDSLLIKKYIEFTIKSRASSRNQKYKLIE